MTRRSRRGASAENRRRFNSFNQPSTRARRASFLPGAVLLRGVEELRIQEPAGGGDVDAVEVGLGVRENHLMRRELQMGKESGSRDADAVGVLVRGVDGEVELGAAEVHGIQERLVVDEVRIVDVEDEPVDDGEGAPVFIDDLDVARDEALKGSSVRRPMETSMSRLRNSDVTNSRQPRPKPFVQTYQPPQTNPRNKAVRRIRTANLAAWDNEELMNGRFGGLLGEPACRARANIS